MSLIYIYLSLNHDTLVGFVKSSVFYEQLIM